MGQQRFEDGVYFGSFDVNMLPSGKGLFTYNDTDAVYQGSWKNGLQDGWGTFKDESSSFEGSWKEGQKVEGTLKYLDEQEEYVGTFIHGEKHCGVLTNRHYTFSGEFLNSCKFSGKMTFAGTSEIYEGDFNTDGQFHGHGKHTNEFGDFYSGAFENNLRHGYGLLELAN
jgi:hypothetical protein